MRDQTYFFFRRMGWYMEEHPATALLLLVGLAALAGLVYALFSGK
jgi:hypothetical protein